MVMRRIPSPRKSRRINKFKQIKKRNPCPTGKGFFMEKELVVSGFEV